MLTVSKATVSCSTSNRGNDCHELAGSLKTKTVQDSLALTKHRRLVSPHLTSTPKAFRHQKLNIHSQHPTELLLLPTMLFLPMLTDYSTDSAKCTATGDMKDSSAADCWCTPLAGEWCSWRVMYYRHLTFAHRVLQTLDFCPPSCTKSWYLKHDSIIAMLACDSTM